MKLIAFLATVLFVAALPAQAPQFVPVRNEPRHHLAFENSYVRVFRVEVAPHDSTLLHEHALDYVFVSLGPADIISAPLGKPELHMQLKDTEVHFARAKVVHVARNLSDLPFRNLTIEFLLPQGEARNLCEKVIPGDLGPCEKLPPGEQKGYSITPLFETDEMRVESIRLDPGAAHTLLVSSGNSLLAALDQADIQVEAAGAPSATLRTGDLHWVPAASQRTFSNLRQSAPSIFLRITFKDIAAVLAKPSY